MLILVTVSTQVFPVGSIRGIVPVIAIFMVYGQEVSIFVREFSPALSTDKPMNPE